MTPCGYGIHASFCCNYCCICCRVCKYRCLYETAGGEPAVLFRSLLYHGRSHLCRSHPPDGILNTVFAPDPGSSAGPGLDCRTVAGMQDKSLRFMFMHVFRRRSTRVSQPQAAPGRARQEVTSVFFVTRSCSGRVPSGGGGHQKRD